MDQQQSTGPTTDRGSAIGGVDDLAALTTALEAADELPLDERLALLQRTEEAIARSLEALDGL